MNIRILIVDDEALARERVRTLLEQESGIEIIGESSNGLDALAAIRKDKPDLVFLDVQMPELDGFEVVAGLDPESVPAIIFVTAYDEFALRAFEVHALDYLLKPFDRARFQKAMERALRQIQSRQSAALNERLSAFLEDFSARPRSSQRLAIKADGRYIILKLDQIDWIESADNYVVLHAGKESHVYRETLSALESSLPQDKFTRVSRSVIVNIDRVKEVQPMFHGDYALILHTGARITFSRGYKEKLGILLGRK